MNTGLNELVASFGQRVVLLDLASRFRIPPENKHPKVETDVSAVWDIDLLHFSPKGSELVGEYVWKELVRLAVLPSPVTTDLIA